MHSSLHHDKGAELPEYYDVRVGTAFAVCKGWRMKGAQKPKKLAKKAPQKSLKEQRAAKAAKKAARG
jgi:hypothetical protein